MPAALYDRIVAKKTELDRMRPLPGAIMRRLLERLQIEYTYHSNAIEGNTLTLRETRLVIAEGLTVGGKPLRDVLEARNHPKAIRYVEKLADAQMPLGEHELLTIHRLILEGVEEAKAGSWRDRQVAIAGHPLLPPPPVEIPVLMQELMEHLRRNPDDLRPVELAAYAHWRLTWIHPFVDGNGRVARLLLNLLLLRHGYPLTVFRREHRRRYLNTLATGDRGDPQPFLRLVGQTVEHSLNLYLAEVRPRTTYATTMIPLAGAAKDTPYNVNYLGLLARLGRLEAVKQGGRWYVTRWALEQYLRRTGPLYRATHRSSDERKD